MGPVAQLVEQLTFNQRVTGSNPVRLTITEQGLGRDCPGPFLLPLVLWHHAFIFPTWRRIARRGGLETTVAGWKFCRSGQRPDAGGKPRCTDDRRPSCPMRQDEDQRCAIRQDQARRMNRQDDCALLRNGMRSPRRRRADAPISASPFFVTDQNPPFQAGWQSPRSTKAMALRILRRVISRPSRPVSKRRAGTGWASSPRCASSGKIAKIS